jgi:hypothetical protein
VRWWLNTDHGKMGVDNAVVGGLDVSSLDPSIWMVQWTDGKGEIERQVDANTNDNGLRETFIDIVPYCPFFQQFLANCPRLTLTQAKKLDVDLIRQIFESKRQAPFHYPIAAGDYWWDATDEMLFASTSATLQNVIATVNALVAAMTTLINNINGHLSDVINTNIAPVGNKLVMDTNATIEGINSGIVNPANSAFDYIDAHAVDPGNALVNYINGVMLGVSGDGANNINNRLQTFRHLITVSESVAYYIDAATPGLGGGIGHSSVGFLYNPYRTTYAPYVAPGTFSTVTYVPGHGVAPVPAANVQWIPIGSTVAVPVTAAEQSAILAGIAARTNDLNVKKNIKIGQVNALTTIAAVIAYDVTTGW